MFLRREMINKGLSINEIDKYASTKKLKSYLLMKDVFLRSFPTRIFKNWKAVFSDIQVISFNEIKNNPIDVIYEIENFLNIENKGNNNFDLPLNKKKYEPKITNTQKYIEIIDEFLGDEINKYKELLL